MARGGGGERVCLPPWLSVGMCVQVWSPAGRGGLSWPKFICDFIYRVTGPTWDEEAVHCDTDARAPR
jgi:hypothetical protein